MKPNVLIVYARSTAEIFNRQSALGSYIHCLAIILVKNGYNVRINELAFNAAPQQETKSVVGAPASALKKMIPAFVKEFIKDKRLFRATDALFKQIDNGAAFDKILEFYTYGSDIGYRLSQKYNKPLALVYDNPVLEEHAFFNPGQLFFKSIIRSRERQSLLQAQSVVVYSAAVKTFLEKNYGVKNLFIHQNVDYTRFEYVKEKPAAGIINIGFIGSFLKWHRVDLLLKAFETLRSEGYPVKLFLLGNGMDFKTIQQQAQQNKYAAEIEMPGFMDGQQLFNYKEKLHIGVMPGSNWYGAPNKIFEYGAAKMAVVAPDTPTIKSLFEDGKELLLFKQDDVNDLTAKLRSYLNDRNLLQQKAEALQLKIWTNYSENITFEFYDRLVR